MRSFRLSRSLILSITLHVIFFTALFTTISFEVKKPPIMINLAKNPGNDKKIVQAALIDKRAIDLANQRRVAEAMLQQEKLLEQKRLSEQIQIEAEQAKQALELAAALKAQQQAKLEQAKQEQAKKIQEQVKKSQEQAKLEQQFTKQQAVAKQQQAAALKAEHDRIVADQQAMLEEEVDKYRAEFAAAIEENRVLSSVFAGDIRCKLKIMLLPDGSIFNIKVLESSGNDAYDQMSAKAVYKSAPFPMPQDKELYKQLREVILSFKNGEQ